MHVVSLARPLALILLTATGLTAVARAQPEDVEIRAQPVAEGIWVLFGQGGNIGACVGDDGVFLVDDQYAPLTEPILAKLAELGGGDVRFVLNTHFHGDHIGGNENLAGRGAVVVAHENARTGMMSETLIEVWDRVREPAPEGAWPVVTFTRDITFHLNGQEVHVFHVGPAHTDGDCVVHFREANVIHVGDIFFNGLYPLIDTGVGGHADGILTAVRRVLELCDEKTVIVPGHGEVSDAAGLRRYVQMLADVTDRVRAGVAAGKSLDEIRDGNPTAKWDAAWGQGFNTPDQIVEMVYRGLTMDDDS